MSRSNAAASLFLLPILAGCTTIEGRGAAPTAPTAVQEAPSTPAFRAGDLEGKDGADLDAALGAPDLTRVEGPGEFRRYTLAECALIIILYPDDQGVKRAARLDAGALLAGEEKPDLDRCLARGKAEPA